MNEYLIGTIIDISGDCDMSRHYTICLFLLYACTISCDLPDPIECHDGDLKCDENVLIICKNNGWSIQQNCLQNSQICVDELLTCGCINGSKQCLSNTLQVCKQNKWVDEENCLKQGMTCNSLSQSFECGECTDGHDIFFEKDNICQTYHCQQGKLSLDSTTCKHSCLSDDNHILDGCGECLNGSERFVENQSDSVDGNCIHEICSHGKWTYKNTCDNSVSCKYKDNEDKTQYIGCGECKNGQIKVIENENIHQCSTQTCQNGIWETNDQFCENSCFIADDGTTSCDECINASTLITENNGQCQLKTCVDGSYKNSAVSCPFSCKVVRTEDGAIDHYSECGECINGTTQCQNQKLSRCIDGIMKEIDDCASHKTNCIEIEVTTDSGTSITSHQCSECKTGSQEIFNDPNTHQCRMKSCIDGKWEYASPCGENSCTNDKKCGQCLNGSIVCDANNKTICQDGILVPYSDCDKSCQNPGTCTDSTAGIGILCTKDQKTYPCDLKSCNASKTDCGICQNGSKRYIENSNKCEEQTCINGAWSSKTCDSNASCRGTKDNYTGCGECTNGNSVYKEENGLCYQKTCTNGAFDNFQPCTNQNSCIGTNGNYSKCGTCKNGTSQYVENEGICSLKTCQNGSIQHTECENKVSCTKFSGSFSGCGKCKNGSVKYTENSDGQCVTQTCKDGKYETENCSSKVSCEIKDGKKIGCGSCLNGKKKYSETNHICSYKTCSDGKWGSNKECQNQVSCAVNSSGNFNKCGECQNSKNVYNENPSGVCYYKTCQNGVLSTSTKCKGNELFSEVSCTVSSGNYSGCGDCRNGFAKCYDPSTLAYCRDGDRFTQSCSCKSDQCR